LRQIDYLLGFVSHNKYALKTTIGKKWPEYQTKLEEDTYESPNLVYYKDADVLVPIVKTCVETTPPMLESWNDSDEDTPKDVAESSMGMHNEITSNLQGYPPYYKRRG
jgi:hypothetical protein